MFKKWTVLLSEEQEEQLLELVTRGNACARAIRRAHTLLLAWEGKTDEHIAAVLRGHSHNLGHDGRTWDREKTGIGA